MTRSVWIVRYKTIQTNKVCEMLSSNRYMIVYVKMKIPQQVSLGTLGDTVAFGGTVGVRVDTCE